MKSNTKKIAKIALFVSAVLCLALILVQFLPYWTAPDDPNYKPAGSETTAPATEAGTEAGTEAATDATEEATEATKKKVGLLPVVSLEDEPLEPETDPISIFNFLILPEDHPYIARHLGAQSKTHPEVINSLAGTFCIVLLLGAVSIALIVLKPNKLWVSAFPVFVGIASLIGYLTEPVWAMGNPGIHAVLIALSAALSVSSLVACGIWLYSFKFWFMDPKKLENNQ